MNIITQIPSNLSAEDEVSSPSHTEIIIEGDPEYDSLWINLGNQQIRVDKREFFDALERYHS